MQLTGHKARSGFDRYNIVDGRDLRTAAGQLDVTWLTNSRASRIKNRTEHSGQSGRSRLKSSTGAFGCTGRELRRKTTCGFPEQFRVLANNADPSSGGADRVLYLMKTRDFADSGNPTHNPKVAGSNARPSH
jgi:hypothetical protein